MELVTLIGLVAAACSSFSLLPQVIKTIKTRHIKDLSLNMYVVLAASAFLWLLYGILIHDLPLILSSVPALIFAIIIIFLIIKYK